MTNEPSVDHHTAVREAARVMAQKSRSVATSKRLAKWAALGVDPDAGQKIYTAGYMAGYQAAERAMGKKA